MATAMYSSEPIGNFSYRQLVKSLRGQDTQLPQLIDLADQEARSRELEALSLQKSETALQNKKTEMMRADISADKLQKKVNTITPKINLLVEKKPALEAKKEEIKAAARQAQIEASKQRTVHFKRMIVMMQSFLIDASGVNRLKNELRKEEIKLAKLEHDSGMTSNFDVEHLEREEQEVLRSIEDEKAQMADATEKVVELEAQIAQNEIE